MGLHLTWSDTLQTEGRAKMNETKTLLNFDRDRITADWYIEKYQTKMKGSTRQTAKGWVEGTNESETVQFLIWNGIKNNL